MILCNEGIGPIGSGELGVVVGESESEGGCQT